MSETLAAAKSGSARRAWPARAGRRIAWALLAAAGAAACRAPRVEERVLFVGNSYVFTNDLPAMFRTLAESAHRHVEVGMLATGGWTLQQHAAAPATDSALAKSAWTRVVLQEQSVLPALRNQRAQMVNPAVRALAARIRARHAAPMLLSTWARRDGLPTAGFASFEAMQAELDEGYRAAAEEAGTAIIPAGAAWASAHDALPPFDLWGPDGSHPSVTGTYLTACVVFATVLRQSPVGLPTVAGVDQASARRLQAIAARIALAPPAP